jgi:hypothetical protein
LLRDRVVKRPRNAESEIDVGVVGVLILAPTFLRVDAYVSSRLQMWLFRSTTF